MEIPNLPTVAWGVLGFVGFITIVVPAGFRGLRVCVAEYYKFKRWFRRTQRAFRTEKRVRSS